LWRKSVENGKNEVKGAKLAQKVTLQRETPTEADRSAKKTAI